eukprot:TRINITY_DN2560_c0_g1_i1.p1 TRINITY_DN2560_c0_g1~~TRINITY_DN2560_c0_g1_i1.p1  ORF type:complete len:330 (-),score=120.54 TRINITY_DN2560_c0_g1_i1:125-1114(-)
MEPTGVVVHPLVLLSTVDHYNRMAKGTSKRVVGALLGSVDRDGQVDITNSFALPFDEAKKGIWFVDHNYHENMYGMFKKVNAREKLVGWYSTGSKIQPNDLDIHDMFRRYCTPELQARGMSAPVTQPVLVVIDVKPKELGIPTKAYKTVEEVSEEGKEPTLRFQHIPSEIGALEAEEVGVEHLLRDVKDNAVSSLATDVGNKLIALRSLGTHLQEMHDYLEMVVSKKLPVNHQIVSQIQDIFNLMPNLNADEVVRSFAIKTNDMMLAIYLSSLIRSIIALHNLINNKISNRKLETADEDAKKAEEEIKDTQEIEDIKKRKDEADAKKSS